MQTFPQIEATEQRPVLTHSVLSEKFVVLRVKMDGIDFHSVCQCHQNKQ